MSDVTIILTAEQAEALLPRRSGKDSLAYWNRRMSLADEAYVEIRAALRDQPAPAPEDQPSLDGMAA